MGKRLIIKGADFSANALSSLTWYVNIAENLLQGNKLDTYTVRFRVSAESIATFGLAGKTVNVIKLYAQNAGTFEIGQATFGTGASYTGAQTYTCVQGINTIELSTPLTLSSTQTIYVNGQNVITYWEQVGGDTTKGWRYLGESSTSPGNSTIPICFGFKVS